MRCLSEYYAEADPTTAVLKDPRVFHSLQQGVSRIKKKMELRILQIKEITEEEFSQRAAAATVAAPFPPPASSAAPPPATDHSRSPRRTLVRHTPFESVKGLLPKLSDAEMHVILALSASRLAPKHVTPQTSLIAAKLELQREVMQRPWREWADVVAPMIARWRAAPYFEPRDLNAVNHMTYDRVIEPIEGSFHEAVEFLFNWPPHEGRAGSFKKTRCCELDPPIVARTWYKSGPLCPVSRFKEFAKGVEDGPYRIPHEAHAVFYAEVQFVDCQNDLTPLVRIRYKHFLENRGWVAALPPPDFKLWASTVSRFEWCGRVVDYDYLTDVAPSPEEARALAERLRGDDDAAEARVLGITKEGYLGLLDGQAITKEAYLAQAPIPVFLEAPEPTAADRLASMRAKLKAQGMEVPELTSNQATTMERRGWRAQLLDEEEVTEEPTQADIDFFVRESAR